MGIKALIVLNKADLLDERTRLHEQLADYSDIGYSVIQASSRAPGGMKAFVNHLRGETSILTGQSGVGKSSLVKTLLPDLDIQTNALSRATGQGRHTTSAATLYFLPNGGALIDSPGVRSFRLTMNDRQLLEKSFREFRPYLGRCQFGDCAHESEPGCALIEAAMAGRIPRRRLENFRRMARDVLTRSD
jgi:ribosome biogenesis GTPase